MNVLKRLPGNGKESGKPRQSRAPTIGSKPSSGSAVRGPGWQSTDLAGLFYLLVDCFAYGMSQPLDLVFYHQLPAL
jgi:hypothetical protein